jgi:DNA modification methylase
VRKDTQHYQHPTQKPVAILTPLIKNSSAINEIVVDLFCGSGSTVIAAQQLDRKAFVMEFSPAFCDVIRKRYAKFINKEDKWEEFTPAE